MNVVRVRDEAALADAFDVRVDVFVDEQDVAEELEFDEHDEDALHFVAYDGDDAVGVARLRASGRQDGERVGKVERVAVRQSHRGGGWGDAVMDAVEDAARQEGFGVLVLHAQTQAEGFYARRGYETDGEPFDEAGIPHVHMTMQFDG